MLQGAADSSGAWRVNNPNGSFLQGANFRKTTQILLPESGLSRPSSESRLSRQSAFPSPRTHQAYRVKGWPWERFRQVPRAFPAPDCCGGFTSSHAWSARLRFRPFPWRFPAGTKRPRSTGEVRVGFEVTIRSPSACENGGADRSFPDLWLFRRRERKNGSNRLAERIPGMPVAKRKKPQPLWSCGFLEKRSVYARRRRNARPRVPRPTSARELGSGMTV